MGRTNTILLYILLGLGVSGIACKRGNAPATRNTGETSKRQTIPASPPVSHAEAWVSKPFAQWPQIVLTNEASFQGHTSLEGASCFLIRNEKGKVFLATARHLLGAAGGVDPAIKVDQLDKLHGSWRVFPRTKPEKAMVVDRIALPNLDANDRDWLVFNLKPPLAPSPAIPLRLRQKPVAEGESVFMVGCSYADSNATQNVYKGRVTKRFYKDYWRFDIDPPVELAGFSGAPILDKDGLVVGVVTVYFKNPKTQGDKWLEAGGEDVGSLFEAIEPLE